MPSNRKPSQVVAEAIRELSHELDEQRQLLTDIKGILVHLSDGLSEHRQHTMQAVNELGKRVLQLEARTSREQR